MEIVLYNQQNSILEFLISENQQSISKISGKKNQRSGYTSGVMMTVTMPTRISSGMPTRR